MRKLLNFKIFGRQYLEICLCICSWLCVISRRIPRRGDYNSGKGVLGYEISRLTQSKALHCPVSGAYRNNPPRFIATKRLLEYWKQ